MDATDASDKKGEPVLRVTSQTLQAACLEMFQKDFLHHNIRWEGNHAAWKPERDIGGGVDEIKVYWPLLNEFLRTSAYGLKREMCKQEIDIGELLAIPVGEYPDLNNVKSHSSLQRTRSASIKQIFGFSSMADAGDDDTDGSPRGSTLSGKIIRRNSMQSSPRTSLSGSPKIVTHKALRASVGGSGSPSSYSTGSTGTPGSSPQDGEFDPHAAKQPSPASFSSNLSSKLLGSFGTDKRFTQHTQHFLSFRRRILFEAVNPEYFRELTRSFDARAVYLQEKPQSLLPKVIGMLRLSQRPDAAGRGGTKSKLKAYYVLSILPFPMENHEHVFALNLRGNGEAGNKVGVGPYAESLFLSDGDFSREHEILLSTYKRVELVAQLASDLGHLQHHGRLYFAVICVVTLRDPVLGGAYSPGAPLGPESTTNSEVPFDERPVLLARHDLPRGVPNVPQALLPVPTSANMERPQWEYYMAVHESTDGVGAKNWTGWLSAHVGAHEYTSRLLKFLKERLLIDGGEEVEAQPVERVGED